MNEYDLSIPTTIIKHDIFGRAVYCWNKLFSVYLESLSLTTTANDLDSEAILDDLKANYSAKLIKTASFLDNYIQFESLEQKVRFQLQWSR